VRCVAIRLSIFVWDFLRATHPTNSSTRGGGFCLYRRGFNRPVFLLVFLRIFRKGNVQTFMKK